MGRVLDATELPVPDFNLDADRGYGYRTWDWIRGDQLGENGRHQSYPRPLVESEGSDRWAGAVERPLSSAIVADDPVQQKLLLHYTEAPAAAGAGPLTRGPLDRGIGLAQVRTAAGAAVLLPQADAANTPPPASPARARRSNRKEVRP